MRFYFVISLFSIFLIGCQNTIDMDKRLFDERGFVIYRSAYDPWRTFLIHGEMIECFTRFNKYGIGKTHSYYFILGGKGPFYTTEKKVFLQNPICKKFFQSGSVLNKFHHFIEESYNGYSLLQFSSISPVRFPNKVVNISVFKKPSLLRAPFTMSPYFRKLKNKYLLFEDVVGYAKINGFIYGITKDIQQKYFLINTINGKNYHFKRKKRFQNILIKNGLLYSAIVDYSSIRYKDFFSSYQKRGQYTSYVSRIERGYKIAHWALGYEHDGELIPLAYQIKKFSIKGMVGYGSCYSGWFIFNIQKKEFYYYSQESAFNTNLRSMNIFTQPENLDTSGDVSPWGLKPGNEIRAHTK